MLLTILHEGKGNNNEHYFSLTLHLPVVTKTKIKNNNQYVVWVWSFSFNLQYSCSACSHPDNSILIDILPPDQVCGFTRILVLSIGGSRSINVTVSRSATPTNILKKEKVTHSYVMLQSVLQNSNAMSFNSMKVWTSSKWLQNSQSETKCYHMNKLVFNTI